MLGAIRKVMVVVALGLAILALATAKVAGLSTVKELAIGLGLLAGAALL